MGGEGMGSRCAGRPLPLPGRTRAFGPLLLLPPPRCGGPHLLVTTGERRVIIMEAGGKTRLVWIPSGGTHPKSEPLTKHEATPPCAARVNPAVWPGTDCIFKTGARGCEQVSLHRNLKGMVLEAAASLPSLSAVGWIRVCPSLLRPSHSKVKVRELGKQRRVGGGAGGAEEGLIRPDRCRYIHPSPRTTIPLDPIHLMLCEIISRSPEK